MKPGVEAAPPPVPQPFAPYLPEALAEVNVPAYVIDRDGIVRWQNDAGLALAGNCVGRLFTEVVAIDQDEAWRMFQSNLAGNANPDRVVELRSPDGGTTTVEVSSVRLGEDHHVVGMFGLLHVEEQSPPSPPVENPLTPRQHEVLVQLAHGASTAAIAERLVVSQETVRNHIRQILKRLNANSRLAAVAAARERGLI